MRISLLTPASLNVLRSSRYAALEPALMPMALSYLGAVLREAGHEVRLRDQAAVTMPNSEVVAEMKAFSPQMIGISVLTGAWHNTLMLVLAIRRELPGVPIVMGNTHAAVFVESILSDGHADIIVRGEGERTIVEVASAIASGDGLDKVLGVTYRDESGVHENPVRPVIRDLDSLPFPAWDLLDLTAWRYQRIPMVNLDSIPLPLMASRGCPYSCTFCSQDKYVKLFRRRKTEKVVEEIDTMINRHGFKAFGFNDSYFPWDEKTSFEFADQVRAHSWYKDTRWVTETRVDRVDDRSMKAMADAGLHAIFFGFESGNPAVLQSLGKGTTVEQGYEAVRIAHRHGVLVIGFFMIGVPGETPQAIEDTFRFAVDAGVDIAKFAVTIPYPGSNLFSMLGRDRLTPEECDQFTSWYDWSEGSGEPIWSPTAMSGREVLALQRKLMLRFYARPGYMLNALRTGLFRPRDMLVGGRLLIERVLTGAIDDLRGR